MIRTIISVTVSVLASAILLTVHLHTGLYAQQPGFKYVRNYTHKEYRQNAQNWGMVQDNRGIIYVANQGGLLEFDGVSWRTINIRNIIVRSLAINDKGTIIYIGGTNEFGYFTRDSRGILTYHSIVNRLEREQRNFATVWKTHWTEEGVYFRTSDYLFRWNPQAKKIKVWKPRPDYPLKTSFIISGKLTIRMHNMGLTQMTGDRLELIAGGDVFKNKSIYMIVPNDSGGKKWLIGTGNNGFYIYDGRSAVPFPTEADNFLRKNILYHGIRLKFSSGETPEFALATKMGGLAVIDSSGKLKQVYDKAANVQDNLVRSIFEDSSGNLWLALNNGITKIEYASPITLYDDRTNLQGQVLSVVKHNGQLYAGTSSGLYRLGQGGKFLRLPSIPANNCHSLLSINDSLIAATNRGVFRVDTMNHTSRQLVKGPAYVLLRSPQNPQRIRVGTDQGLLSLYFKRDSGGAGQWLEEHRIKATSGEIRTIAEDARGNLWLGTVSSGVLYIDFQTDSGTGEPEVSRYHTSHGLPDGEIGVFYAAGHVIFAAQGEGIYRFNKDNKTFIPDTVLGTRFAGGSTGVFRITEDKNKTIWFHSRSKNFRAIPVDDGFEVAEINPLLRIPKAQVNSIYPDPLDPVIWFCSADGLIRYEPGKEKKEQPGFLTLIREVVVAGTPLLYNRGKGRYKTGEKGQDASVPMAFKKRSLRIRFAAPSFQEESLTMYRCLLEGYDDQWSDWSTETWKDYTNLDPGINTIRVQSNNSYGVQGKEAMFRFKVLPHWYETGWAYGAYILLALLGVYLTIKWRLGKLRRETKKLERIVKERTKEIDGKNRQLESQTAQLKDQAVKLKELSEAKSRFFANISHEFRTPLTLIMGPLEQLLSNYRDKDVKMEKKIRLMLRNSHRLFTLINRLLDLSKLDSGKMQLHAVRQNIVPVLKGIVASFDLIAEQNSLDLVFHADKDNIILYIDSEKIEDVLCNLLVNAVKFTPRGGKITVKTKEVHEHEQHFPDGYLEISVCDSGPGIPREQLPLIFDRFFQSDSTYEQHRQGSGIGLALTRELINLHHGRIDVHSRSGEESGTEFIISLPLGSEPFETGEIDTLDQSSPTHRHPFEMNAGITLELEENDNDAEMPDPLKPGKDIILVVEDSADVREYIRGALEHRYQVIEAKDGNEGIQQAQTVIPDLIISDIIMPGKNGYELCETLKKDIKTSHIPIILLTARASEENIIKGLETGVDDYITKPFSTKILTARIKNLIDLRRQFQMTLYRDMTQQPNKMLISQIDRDFIRELQEVIEKNLSDTEFNVEQLGKKLYMSRATLYRKIHALTGESPNEFVQSYRLKRAAELLESNFGSILEVSFEVGFSSSSYFTKCFKKKFNRLPSSFGETDSAK